MRVLENVSLRSFNSFGVTANARYLARLETPSDVEQVLADARMAGLPRLLLGGGSNVLFPGDFPGIVLHVAFKGIRIVDETPEFVYVQAAAGEPWHPFVLETIARGYAGLENLSLIPGTVGAAPVQNIGAYGVELADLFYALEALDLETGEPRRFDKDAAQFAYRDSYFKSAAPNRYLITSVTFQLPRQPQWRVEYGNLRKQLEAQGGGLLSAQRISAAVCALRRQRLPDPAVTGNAGSFFKNPVISNQQYETLQGRFPALRGFRLPGGHHKLSAAWLIDQCGWKGHREGDAGVSERHALVLVNYGNASGADIWRLAQAIMDSVETRFDIRLEPEPCIT